MSLLVPLYIYPWPGVWDPLYAAAKSHPTVNFTVVLNPCSGPCVNGSTPEAPYLAEMPNLKNYNNIRTLGYVATNYTNKLIDEIIIEIETYAHWTTILNDSRMAVNGIFFDETPGAYDWRKYDYLARAQDEVKGAEGLGQRLIGKCDPERVKKKQLKILVHNPGAIPDRVWNYMNLSDITVVFENTFDIWIDRTNFDTLTQFQNVSSHPKSQMAIMLHTLPNLTDSFLKCVAQQLEGMADWFFVTSVGVKDEYWHSFSPLFGGLVAAVDNTE